MLDMLCNNMDVRGKEFFLFEFNCYVDDTHRTHTHTHTHQAHRIDIYFVLK